MEVVAHRGLTTTAPENSLAAIDRRLPIVEVDVRAAADGTLFLLHDASLDRVARIPRRLQTMLAPEAIAAGLASLESALELAAGRVTLALDVKEPATGGRVVAAVRASGADARVWSRYPQVVAAGARAGLPSTLISDGIYQRGLGAFLWTARGAGASAVSFFPADLERHVAASCRNASLRIQCGTPNDERTWRELIVLDADTVITDAPERCRAFLDRTVDAMGPEHALSGTRPRSQRVPP